MRWQLLFLFFLSLVLTLAGSPKSGLAGGPWKAQIVDAETGKPLEGVVVLAYWLKYTESLIGHGGVQFYDAEEVVTGPDGRFVIQARSTWTLIPFKRVGGMELVIFKPGYGRWRVRNPERWSKEQWDTLRKPGRIFEEQNVRIELPVLKTREERLKFLGRVSWAPVVPFERTKRLRKVKDEERAYLGLGKMYEEKP